MTKFRYKIQKALFRFIGDIKWTGICHPFWFTVNAKGYKLKGKHYRSVKHVIQPGDILIRRFDGYVSNWFLPGYWAHAGIYVGKNQVVHSLSDGVIIEDIVNFMRTDHLVVFRPPHETAEEGITRARSIVGSEYDFSFDFEDPKRLSCTEVILYCYPGLIPTKRRFGRTTIIADDIVNTPDLDVVWDSRRSN